MLSLGLQTLEMLMAVSGKGYGGQQALGGVIRDQHTA